MPLARRIASVRASWSEAYCCIRIPPSPGPRVVSCTAMKALSPEDGSVTCTTFSYPSTDISVMFNKCFLALHKPIVF